MGNAGGGGKVVLHRGVRHQHLHVAQGGCEGVAGLRVGVLDAVEAVGGGAALHDGAEGASSVDDGREGVAAGFWEGGLPLDLRERLRAVHLELRAKVQLGNVKLVCVKLVRARSGDGEGRAAAGLETVVEELADGGVVSRVECGEGRIAGGNRNTSGSGDFSGGSDMSVRSDRSGGGMCDGGSGGHDVGWVACAGGLPKEVVKKRNLQIESGFILPQAVITIAASNWVAICMLIVRKLVRCFLK